ncbi:MAG: VTT domain-containing protein [Polyangiaceae bacterium]
MERGEVEAGEARAGESVLAAGESASGPAESAPGAGEGAGESASGPAESASGPAESAPGAGEGAGPLVVGEVTEVPGAARRRQVARIAVVAAVAVGLVVAYRTGLFELFGEPRRVKQALVELGPWGYVAFVGAYAALQPFGVPGTVFILAAPLIWPWPVAFALSMAGTMAASVVGFSFARFVARDWVSKRVPARFKRYEEALEKRGFATVLTLRFVFWMPPMLHVFFGVSRVPFWTHFWGSFFGYLVPLLATAYFGERVFDAMRDAPAEVWGGVAAGMLVVGAGVWLVRRRRRTVQ